MKKIASFLIAVIATISVQAQDFQGMAVYESKTSLGEDMMKFGNREITPEMKKMIEERMKQMLEKTFILNFDKTASIYQEEEKLDTPGQSGGRMRMMMSTMTGGGGKHYKNIKDKVFLIEKEIFGKEFLVNDIFPVIAWKM
jgi:GLPGLI family protein